MTVAARANCAAPIEGGKAVLRDVRLGATVDGRSAVLQGVAAGEAIVLEGIDRLREGSEVRLIDGPTGSAAPAQIEPAANGS
jgi:multidrug efflux system membrane fusion protein